MRELIKAELSKGITQRELAGKLRFSHSTIQKILFTETKHGYDIRKKVADYFGVPVSDFYDDHLVATGQPDITAVSKGGEYTEILKRYIIHLEEENEKLKGELLQFTARESERTVSGGD